MNDLEKRALTDKFMLRMPDGMRDRIRAAAEAKNRSMNSEIVAALEEKYPVSDSVVFARLHKIAGAALGQETLSDEDRDFAQSLMTFLVGKGRTENLETLHWLLQSSELTIEKFRRLNAEFAQGNSPTGDKP